MSQSKWRVLGGSLLGMLSVLFFWLALVQVSHASETVSVKVDGTTTPEAGPHSTSVPAATLSSPVAVAPVAAPMADETGEMGAPDCTTKMAKELAALIDQDQNQILELQLQLTTLKLAAAAGRSRSTTVEHYIAAETAEVQQKDQGGIRAKLNELYRQSGEGEETQNALDQVAPIVSRLERGSYWNKELRLKNQDLSAFVVAHTHTYPEETPFTQEDAAILWMQNQISEVVTAERGRGSAQANLQEVSTQVARLTGVIQGAAKFSVDELDSKVAATQSQVAEQFSSLQEKFSQDLKAQCLSLPDGTPCLLTDLEQSAVFFQTIQEISDRLAQDQAYLAEKAMMKAGRQLRTAGTDLRLEGVAPEVQKETPSNSEVGYRSDAVKVLMQAYRTEEANTSIAAGECVGTTKKGKDEQGRDVLYLTLTENGKKEAELYAPTEFLNGPKPPGLQSPETQRQVNILATAMSSTDCYGGPLVKNLLKQ